METAQTVRGVPVNATELLRESHRLRSEAALSKKCAFCGKPVMPPQRIYCSYECNFDFSRKYYGKPWSLTKDEIVKRDGHKCRRCGRVEPERDRHYCGCEVDHIIEVDRGGTDDPENLQTLCSICHRIKTDSYIRKKWKKPAEQPVVRIDFSLVEIQAANDELFFPTKE